MIKLIYIILFCLTLISCDVNTEKSDTTIVNSNSTIDINKLEQQQLLSEKLLVKNKKPEIEYLTLNLEEVKIPILMYHSISDSDPNNTLLVSPKDFEAQMKWLKDNNFTAMLLDDVVKALQTGRVPKKPVAITFDDGYADNYNSAFQILKKYNQKATFFVITDKIDKDGYYMSSDMLKEIENTGMAIENHTSNHKELNKLSQEEQRTSINTGQSTLKNILKKDIKFLCYPVGRYNDTTVNMLEELGIMAAVTTEGGMATNDDGIYTLDRVRIAPMSLENFSNIFSEFTSQ